MDKAAQTRLVIFATFLACVIGFLWYAWQQHEENVVVHQCLARMQAAGTLTADSERTCRALARGTKAP